MQIEIQECGIVCPGKLWTITILYIQMNAYEILSANFDKAYIVNDAWENESVSPHDFKIHSVSINNIME